MKKEKILTILLFFFISPRMFGTNSDVLAESGPQYSQSDTIGKQLQEFDLNFKNIQKELYDSVKRYQTENIDFSAITGGIERKYDKCSAPTDKILLGYELSKNYFLNYRSSGKINFKEKAENLFYSFIRFKNGVIASRYLKLDLNSVQFIARDWDNFTKKDKEDILFYGLLRGFGNGLPEILKKVEGQNEKVASNRSVEKIKMEVQQRDSLYLQWSDRMYKAWKPCDSMAYFILDKQIERQLRDPKLTKADKIVLDYQLVYNYYLRGLIYDSKEFKGKAIELFDKVSGSDDGLVYTSFYFKTTGEKMKEYLNKINDAKTNKLKDSLVWNLLNSYQRMKDY